MRRLINAILLLALSGLLVSCANGGSSGGRAGVYHHHHGYGPWWGSRTYYHDRVIVVPPEEGLQPEATPLPSGPEHMPDMGMPDVDLGDF